MYLNGHKSRQPPCKLSLGLDLVSFCLPSRFLLPRLSFSLALHDSLSGKPPGVQKESPYLARALRLHPVKALLRRASKTLELSRVGEGHSGPCLPQAPPPFLFVSTSPHCSSSFRGLEEKRLGILGIGWDESHRSIVIFSGLLCIDGKSGRWLRLE